MMGTNIEDYLPMLRKSGGGGQVCPYIGMIPGIAERATPFWKTFPVPTDSLPSTRATQASPPPTLSAPAPTGPTRPYEFIHNRINGQVGQESGGEFFGQYDDWTSPEGDPSLGLTNIM